MASVGKECKQNTVITKLIHKRCSDVRGDLSRELTVSDVGDVTGQSRGPTGG